IATVAADQGLEHALRSLGEARVGDGDALSRELQRAVREGEQHLAAGAERRTCDRIAVVEEMPPRHADTVCRRRACRVILSACSTALSRGLPGSLRSSRSRWA